MYTWKQYTNLPGIKGMDPKQQWQKFYTYQMNETSINNSAAASSAAGAGGGGGGKKITSGRGALFMDNYNKNWEFFLTDENGKITNRKETGISVIEYYVDSTYVIDGKGYVICFSNEADYIYIYVKNDGTIVRTDTLSNHNDRGHRSGRFFFVTRINDGNGFRTITYFDGENVYDVEFGVEGEYSTATVESNTNYYLYEGNSWLGSERYMTDQATGVGIIVRDDLDGETDYKYYSLVNGNKLLINEEQPNETYGYGWHTFAGFGSIVTYNTTAGRYDTLRIVNLSTGNPILSVDISANDYDSNEWVFYGRGKMAHIFWGGTDNIYNIFLYDGATGELVNQTVSSTGLSFDFFCTQAAPSYGFDTLGYNFSRNFISEDIVFIFRSNAYVSNVLDYFDNFNILYIPSGVFDYSQEVNWVPLTDKGVDMYRAMFTENVFTIAIDVDGNVETPGNLGQLLITETNDTTYNFGFTVSNYTNYNTYQLYDSYVYKFFFSGNRDEIFIFDTNGNLDFTGTYSPNNYFYNERELFVMTNEQDQETYYYNNTTKGLSPSLVPLEGPSGNNYYNEETNWSTFWNNTDQMSDGKKLFRGNYNTHSEYVLLTGTSEPVYLDFSYLEGLNNNIYLCKTFIIVQYQDGDGNGFAKVYDYSGNLTQDLAFGYCEWISNDSVVGDMAVIRFTNWGTTKRVFLTKDNYHTYDLVWDPYYHYTLFNDIRWWYND